MLVRGVRPKRINNVESWEQPKPFQLSVFRAHIRSAVAGVPCGWVGTLMSSGQWVMTGSDVCPFLGWAVNVNPPGAFSPLAQWPAKCCICGCSISQVPELSLPAGTADVWSEKAIHLCCCKLLRFWGFYYCTKIQAILTDISNQMKYY